MLTVNAYALQAAASFTKSRVLFVASTTESSFPGPLAPSSGAASNRPGDALAGGLLLIFLFVVALATPLKGLTRQEPDGNKSSLSTSTGLQPKKKTGGTAKE